MKSASRILTTAVLLFSLVGSMAVEAASFRCESLFSPSAARVFEELTPEQSGYLFRGLSLESHTDKLSWLRKRKVRNLINRVNVANVKSAEAIEDYAVELNTALFGSKEIVDRWIFQTKSQRLEESTRTLIGEQLISEGLLKTWQNTHDPAQLTRLGRVLNAIRRVLRNPWGQLVRLPFILPTVRDTKISDELMFAVIRDGFTPHADRIREALSSQNRIEAYNTFRKLYAPVFFAVVTAGQMVYAVDALHSRIDHQVETTISTLKTQRARIERVGSTMKHDEYEAALQASLIEFRAKWNDEPTAEERLAIEIKIKKALNLKS